MKRLICIVLAMVTSSTAFAFSWNSACNKKQVKEKVQLLGDTDRWLAIHSYATLTSKKIKKSDLEYYRQSTINHCREVFRRVRQNPDHFKDARGCRSSWGDKVYADETVQACQYFNNGKYSGLEY